LGQFTSAFCFCGSDKRRGKFVIKLKEEFHTSKIVCKRLFSIASVHNSIEFGMSFSQRARHGHGIVKIGESAFPAAQVGFGQKSEPAIAAFGPLLEYFDRR